MENFCITIVGSIAVSKNIKAESLEDALLQAKKLAEQEKGVRPDKGWDWAWTEKFEASGVSK